MSTVQRLAILASLVSVLCTGIARSEFVGEPVGVAVSGGGYHGALPLPMPVHFWVTGNWADRGLGFQGSYLTVGGLVPVATDPWGGTWFTESRGHLSEEGNFFGNIGFGRRVITEAGMMSLSAWYDYDDDAPDRFGHDFHQVGVSFDWVLEWAHLEINGYIPVGTDTYRLGSAEECFVDNRILIQHGLDTALRGVDGGIGFQIPGLDEYRVRWHVGGYLYRSDAVGTFPGVTTRVEAFPLPFVSFNAQLNHDEQFKTTGIVGVTFHLQNKGHAKDNWFLRSTRRNDHIVRVHQEPIFATNPMTGDLWNVIHVDNTNPDPGSGTAEDPYNALALAEAGSVEDDLIFVHQGTGTTFNYDTGITLKDRQWLLGDGVQHFIPTVEVGLFELCVNLQNNRPVITNPAGPAVTLADDNVVAGFRIQSAQTGIAGVNINNTLINNNLINGSTTNGVLLDTATGDVEISDNTIQGSGQRGIYVVDTTADVLIDGNVVTDSTLSGVDIENSAALVNVTNNTITDNGGAAEAGVRVFNNIAGVTEVLISENTIDGNGNGVILEAADGGLIEADVTDNLSISGNDYTGVVIRAFNGADMDALVDGNNINANGQIAGVAVRMQIADSDFTGVISNNRMAQNLGDNPDFDNVDDLVKYANTIQGTFTGNSNIDLAIEDNVIIGFGAVTPDADPFLFSGNGIDLLYQLSNLTLHSLAITGNNISGIRDDAINIWTQGTTQVAANISDNDIFNNDREALRVVIFDTSHMDLIMENNNMVANFTAGAVLTTVDSGELAARVRFNNIDFNGTDITHDGLVVEAFDTSIAVMLAQSNTTNGNFEAGTRLRLFDTATVYALVRNNSMVINGGAFDFVGELDAAAAGVMSVELTGNTASSGYLLDNPSAGGVIVFQNGGGNTGTITTNGLVILAPLGAPPLVIP